MARAARGPRPSDALVLFGVTGDLAHKMILPALYAKAAPTPDAKDDLKTLPLSDVEEQPGSSPASLSQAEAQERLTRYGPIEIAAKKTNALLKFLTCFWGPIPWMIEGAVISVGEQADGFAQVFPEHMFHIVGVLQKHGHIVALRWRPA